MNRMCGTAPAILQGAMRESSPYLKYSMTEQSEKNIIMFSIWFTKTRVLDENKINEN